MYTVLDLIGQKLKCTLLNFKVRKIKDLSVISLFTKKIVLKYTFKIAKIMKNVVNNCKGPVLFFKISSLICSLRWSLNKGDLQRPLSGTV